MELEFSGQIFAKSSNIKFHENPSSDRRLVPCGQTDRRTGGLTDRQTDMMKLIVAFRNFANASKNAIVFRILLHVVGKGKLQEIYNVECHKKKDRRAQRK
jgi:hypothetical protein